MAKRPKLVWFGYATCQDTLTKTPSQRHPLQATLSKAIPQLRVKEENEGIENFKMVALMA